jgi:mitochondrial chaperone BCS1
MNEQSYVETARDLTVHTSWGSKSKRGRDVYEDYRLVEQKRPNVYYFPAVGIHYLFYKSSLLWFSRNKTQSPAASGGNNVMNPFSYQQVDNMQSTTSTKEFITLSMVGWSRYKLENLIKEAMELTFKKSENKTWIYTSTNYRTNWTKICSRENRTFESVIMPTKTKNLIIDDLKRFLDSNKWYRDTGVPYRRGYLLYGFPGTGKTSYILSVAGQLNMSVCLLNLSQMGMSDDRLSELLNYVPKNAIVVLEDVDCIFKEREPTEQMRGFNTLSFSGLLNAIDGIGSQEGRILFMTTNHLEKLNQALIRPGRIDLKVNFGLANKEQVSGMFLKFFPKEFEIAKKLEDVIPENYVTTAQLQGFLLLNRDNPNDSLKNYEQFLIDSKEEIDKMRESEENDKIKEAQEKKKLNKLKELRALGITGQEAKMLLSSPGTSEKVENGNEFFEKAVSKLIEKKKKKSDKLIKEIKGDKEINEKEIKEKEINGDKKIENKEEDKKII